MEHINLFKTRVSAAIKLLRDEDKLDKFDDVYEVAELVLSKELERRTDGHDLVDVISEVIARLKRGYIKLDKLPQKLGMACLVTDVLEKHTSSFKLDVLSNYIDNRENGMELYIKNNINYLDDLDIQKAYLASVLSFNYILDGLDERHLLLNRFKKNLFAC